MFEPPVLSRNMVYKYAQVRLLLLLVYFGRKPYHGVLAWYSRVCEIPRQKVVRMLSIVGKQNRKHSSGHYSRLEEGHESTERTEMQSVSKMSTNEIGMHIFGTLNSGLTSVWERAFCTGKIQCRQFLFQIRADIWH